jgi:predicted metal-dependent RNase
MKLTDLNRDGGIGANSLFLQLGDLNILIDCGLNPKKVGRAATPDLSLLRGKTLDLVIITHCHLDHIGSLPVVMREHPDAAQFRQRHDAPARGGGHPRLPAVHPR